MAKIVAFSFERVVKVTVKVSFCPNYKFPCSNLPIILGFAVQFGVSYLSFSLPSLNTWQSVRVSCECFCLSGVVSFDFLSRAMWWLGCFLGLLQSGAFIMMESLNSLSLEMDSGINFLFIMFFYKRTGKVRFFGILLFIPFLLSVVIYFFCLLALNMSSFSYKNAILSTPPSLVGNTSVLGSEESATLCEGIVPVVADPLADLCHDPPSMAAADEVAVLDDLDQVKNDIAELTRSCLVGKVLGAPIEFRTIMSKTKADWKF